MKKIFLIFTLSIVSLMWFSCDSDKIFTSEETPVLPISAFPHNDGSSWVYQVYDSATASYDTVVVTITDSNLTHTGDNYSQLWSFDFGSDIYTQTTVFLFDTVSIDWVNQWLNIHLAFPLKVGSLWHGENVLDTTQVLAIESRDVPAGVYDSTFHVRSIYTGIDVIHKIDMWLVPDIGIIRIKIATSGMTTILNQTWELISYQPNSSAVFNIDQFPVTFGSWWEYQLNNRKESTIDTVHITLAGSTFVDDSLWFYIWEREFSTYTDSLYTNVLDNTVRFFNLLRSDILYTMLEFPLETGNAWSAFLYNDTSEVIQKLYFSTEAGNFPNSYRVLTYLWCGDECGHEINSYYSPNVGLIYRDDFAVEIIPTYDSSLGGDILLEDTLIDETWELLDYNIAL